MNKLLKSTFLAGLLVAIVPTMTICKEIKLYTYSFCGPCKKVKKHLQEHDKSNKVTIIQCDKTDNKGNRTYGKEYQDLKKASGKDICPFLHDEINDKKVSGSNSIISYLKEIL